ncbi:MAG: transposase, partial [Schwartzia sp.]|nr:transposase [Schwartzia sp. (in: firmicutes)]
MPRQPRTPGEFFHVVVRGIGRQILFENDDDRRKYLALLEKYQEENDITLMAYCLMDNHVHLLIRDNNGSLSLFMKQMGVSYALYYNRKYERVGHLFQDRYKSEVVDREEYLLTAYRYILNNPVKA